MRVLVTGAAGFMGSHLVDALLAEGHEVYGVDDLSGGFMRNVPAGCRFTRLDLRDRALTDVAVDAVSLPGPIDVLYHLAADATEGRSQFTPHSACERNLAAYLNTLVPAIRCGVRKVVLTSSMSVYGAQTPPFSEGMPRQPVDVYGHAKAAMEGVTEALADVHGFRYTIIRPHNVYGPRQNLADPYRNVVAIFVNRLLRGLPPLVYGDGEQRRAFSYIDDFTPYCLRCGFEEQTDGQILNIGPREECTVNTLARLVLEAFGEDPDGHLAPVHVPDRPREVKSAFCTCEKAERLLGYRTTVPLAEGIRRMVEWAKALGPQAPRYLDELELPAPNTPETWTMRLI